MKILKYISLSNEENEFNSTSKFEVQNSVFCIV